MEFSIASVLASFSDDKLVAPKALEKKLNCESEPGLRQLQIALEGLEKLGVLEKDRGRYRRLPEENVIEGKLRCSSKGFCFAIQDIEGADDIYIRESQLGTAWNGDRVLVKVVKEGRKRRSPEGEVRLILERANPSVLARVKQTDDQFRAVPLDDRLLFEVALEAQPGQNLSDFIDHLVHVEILRYPIGQLPPIGRVTQSLGSDDHTASDWDIVCCKHDLPRHFSDDLLKSVKKIPEALTKAEIKKRLDLRQLETFSLKPVVADAIAEGLDDAITLEPINPDRWQLGIHITDVVPYLPPDSPLDREAQKRGTSVYLDHTVIPILPEEFSSQYCSLLPGHDRLAVSVLVTLDAEGKLVEFEVQPTVIRVNYLISFDQAQAILEHQEALATDSKAKPSEEIKAFAAVFSKIAQLYTLSRALKQQREERGAFALNLPDTKFHYDDEGVLGAVVISDTLPARAMLVELMVLANQLIASHLQALDLPGIYRVHPTPDPEDVQELTKLAASLKIDLHLEDEENVRPSDYQRFTRQFAESEVEKVLTYLLRETLKPAVYSRTPKPHFGLALDQGYTHFTSPLRRYPDLIIQRILHAVFEDGRDRRTTRSKDRVNLRHSSCHGQVAWNVLPTDLQTQFEEMLGSLVVYLSECEKEALEAEEDMEGLGKAGFMRDHTGGVFRGLITGVQSYGLFVEIEELLVEGLVHVSSLKDDWYEYRSRQQILVGRRNRRQYRLGDRIMVQVKNVDYYRQQIDLIVAETSDENANQPTTESPVDDEPDFDLEDSGSELEDNED